MEVFCLQLSCLPSWLVYYDWNIETFAKRLFSPQHCCVLANAHLLLNELRFAAELENKITIFAGGLGIVQNSHIFV